MEDFKDLRDLKDLKDLRDLKNLRDLKDLKNLRDLKELRDLKDLKDLRDLKDFRDLKDLKGLPTFSQLKFPTLVFYSVSDCLNCGTCGTVAHLPSVLRQHSLPCHGGGVQPGPASCLLSAVRPGLSVFCLLHNIQSVHIDPPRPSVRATDTTRKLSSSRDFVDNTLSDTPVATLVTIWRLSVGVGSSEY